jgi:hypothetical protein
MAIPSPLIRFSILGLLLLSAALPAWSREEPSAPRKKGHRTWMDLSDQDKWVPVTSVEWGIPDRWSLTTRYVHMFDKDRDNKKWLNNLTVALSPGTDGGRLGVGYVGVFSPKPVSKPDWAMFVEGRAVLLRTWRNPLETGANRTFVGAEIRFSPTILFNIGGGYYRQVSTSDGSRDSFWGYHIGIGP